ELARPVPPVEILRGVDFLRLPLEFDAEVVGHELQRLAELHVQRPLDGCEAVAVVLRKALVAQNGARLLVDHAEAISAAAPGARVMLAIERFACEAGDLR